MQRTSPYGSCASLQIWMQTKGKVTHVVAGGSTGGTISGTGRFLKDMNPDIFVMLPDPVGSVFWDFWAKRIKEEDLKANSYQVREASSGAGACKACVHGTHLCHALSKCVAV